MSKQFTKEEKWKLYNKLPDELKHAVFSAENADYIGSICERSGISELSPDIASHVGLVLLGLLPPEYFQQAIQHDVGLDEKVALSVTQEMDRFVFEPVRQQLNELYGKETPREDTPVPEVPEEPIRKQTTSEGAPRKAPPQRTSSEGSSGDPYREPIEE